MTAQPRSVRRQPTPAAGGAYTTGVLATGSHSLTARATDVAGNTGAASSVVTVSTAAAPTGPRPDAPKIISFSNDSGTAGDGVTNDNTVTLTGTAAAGSTVRVYDGATQIGTTTANSSGAWSYTTAALSNGNHPLAATATTSAGGMSPASSTLVLKIDTTAPNAATIATPTNNGNGTLNLTGSAEANSTVKVYDGTTEIGTATANASGGWTYTTGVLATGSHSLTAQATDAAGNTGAASSAVTVSTNASPTPAPAPRPDAPKIISFSNDSGTVGDGVTNDNTVTLTGTAAAGSAIRVYDGATQIGTATADSSGAWSYTTAALSDGKHPLAATATTAGGMSPASSTLVLTIDTKEPRPEAPKIISFSNDSGTVGDGVTNDNTVTLTGTAAAGSAIRVYDGATQIGTTTANSSGAWSYTTAALPDGTHPLAATATTAGGMSPASSTLVLTIDTKAPDTTGAPAGRPEDHLVLERQRHRRRRRDQRQHGDPDRHRGCGQRHQGVRRRDPDRDDDGKQQRRVELHDRRVVRRQPPPCGNGHHRGRHEPGIVDARLEDRHEGANRPDNGHADEQRQRYLEPDGQRGSEQHREGV